MWSSQTKQKVWLTLGTSSIHHTVLFKRMAKSQLKGYFSHSFSSILYVVPLSLRDLQGEQTAHYCPQVWAVATHFPRLDLRPFKPMPGKVWNKWVGEHKIHFLLAFKSQWEADQWDLICSMLEGCGGQLGLKGTWIYHSPPAIQIRTTSFTFMDELAVLLDMSKWLLKTNYLFGAQSNCLTLNSAF